MYKKILVPLALSHGYGEQALQLARTLQAEGGEIIALHVFEFVDNTASLFVPEEEIQKVRQSAKQGMAKRIGDAKDIDVVWLTGHAGVSIIQYAKKISADCIIVGSHKPGLQDYFLGSTSARIMRYAQCSVHVLR